MSDDQVLEVVREMDAALQTGDVEAFLAHVAPELQKDQRAWFEAVRSVPMEVRQLRADRVIARTSPAGTVLHVGLRHQVTGADSVPLLQKYRWVLAPDVGGQPVLVETSGGNGAVHGFPQLWDLGPVAALQADAATLLGSEATRAEAEALLPGISEASRLLLQDFPSLARSREGLLVQLVGAGGVAQMLQTEEGDLPSGATWLRASATDPGLDRADLGPGEDVFHPRLILDVDVALDDLDMFGESPGGNTYLRYEGAWAAILGESERTEPVEWLLSGVPIWYELSGDPAWEQDLLGIAVTAHVDGPPDALPGTRWDEEDEAGQQAAAVSFVRHLEETEGRDTVLALVTALTELDMSTDEEEVWPTVTAAVHRSEAELLRDWQTWGEELLTRAEALEPSIEEG